MFLENKFSFEKSSKTLGLLIIITSFVIFDDYLINEFYTKLFCLIGVFLYLIKSEEVKYVELLNNNPFIQQIGLISFSLYLFHQPIFVFFRIYDAKVDNLSSISFLGLLIFLYIISLINWKFIETPFQDRFNKTKNNFRNYVCNISSIHIYITKPR